MLSTAAYTSNGPAGDLPTAFRLNPVYSETGEVNYRYRNASSNKDETLLEQMTFSCGIVMRISDFSPVHPISVTYDGMKACVGMGFCLSRRLSGYWHKGEVLSIEPGQHAIFAAPDLEVHSEVLAREHVRRVSFWVAASRLPALEDAYPELYRLPLFKPKSAVSISVRPTDTRYYVALMQILHCPFTGTARRLFMEGKVMEILSYAIEEEGRHARGNGGAGQGSSIADMEKAHHAAYLLTRDLRNPPDLHEVAHEAGVCKSKLHQIFRKTYDVTPFEYLRKHRLEKAREMLLEGRLNVTEAAMEVGYSSLSHFSKAFADHFNHLPGEFKKSDRLLY